MVWTIITGLLILLFLTLLTRTLSFKPLPARNIKPEKITVNGDRAARNLSHMIRKRTVSSRFVNEVDENEFSGFINLLPELYPEAHKVLEREITNLFALLYKWKGTEGGNPLVLMSHYDVVSASPEGWEHPPFEGTIKDGVIWGRGALDNKATLAAVMEAVEQLLTAGFTPKNDIYLAFGGDEEIMGTGAKEIVSWFRERGITPRLVVDEGGSIVEDIFPGVRLPVAAIGVAEKGVTDIELIVKGIGGHASTPPSKGAAYKLSRAIMRIEKRPFRAFFPGPTLEMIDKLGRHAPFGLRMVFANMWFFRPFLLQLFKRLGKETNAMCRTTVAITMLEGSKGANVLPPKVKAVANVRIAVGRTLDETLKHLEKAVHDPNVEFNMIYPGEPPKVSETDDVYDFLGEVINETWPDAVVSPFIMLGASDSRHYAAITSHVYRFWPFKLSKKERDSMHSVNECLPVSALEKAIEFYIRLIMKS